MGVSFSTGRRNRNNYHHVYRPPYYHHNPPPPYFYSYGHPAYLTPPPPPPPPTLPPPNHVYVFASPYAPPNYHCHSQYPQTSFAPNYYSTSFNYANPLMDQVYYGAHPHPNGWPHTQMGAPVAETTVLPPPGYVEHQTAKVVKNDVNVRKDTLRLVVDDHNPDQHLVAFIFDAHYDGSITIYYFGKEAEGSFKFSAEFPEVHKPVQIPFKKGLGQRFCQPSGTGVDLGFFELQALGKPTEDGVFPLVIYAEVYSSSHANGEAGGSPSETSPRVQVSQAVIEKKSDGSFQVKVIRQILCIDGVRYEVRELFGVGITSEQNYNDDDPGKACVICMTEPKDTAVMPCRHLCMCSECAKELRLRTDKCPICRQPITELIEIKINNAGQ